MPVVDSADQEQYVGEEIYLDDYRFQISTENCPQHVDGLQEMHAQDNARRNQNCHSGTRTETAVST
jgi:hypothetical protein